MASYSEPYASVSDGELVRALIAKEPRAPQIVWQRFLPLVTRVLHRALPSDGDVDDLVQDVFLGVFHGIHRLREPEALRAFVIGTTKKIISCELRRRRIRGRLNFEFEAQQVTVTGDVRDAAARHAFVRFRRLLELLREREREAFILRFVARMEAKEVAKTMGVSVSTARRAFSSAWRRLAAWGSSHPFLCDYVEGPAALPAE